MSSDEPNRPHSTRNAPAYDHPASTTYSRSPGEDFPPPPDNLRVGIFCDFLTLLSNIPKFHPQNVFKWWWRLFIEHSQIIFTQNHHLDPLFEDYHHQHKQHVPTYSIPKFSKLLFFSPKFSTAAVRKDFRSIHTHYRGWLISLASILSAENHPRCKSCSRCFRHLFRSRPHHLQDPTSPHTIRITTKLHHRLLSRR